MTVAIRFTDVCKGFRLHQLLRTIMQRPTAVEVHHALRDVSFEIAPGESVGVVGRNGAGKSTLLSLIAQTAYPTSGTVEVNGRVGPLLELGAGFHSDLSGHENIFLNGLLLGLTRKQIEERFDRIAAYAEIGKFLESPVNTYSTGMRARLGFAVIAHIDPDILLLDEVLGVGDRSFFEKCRKTLFDFRDRGKTMFFVSHNLEDIETLCDRALWIEDGRLVDSGCPHAVVRDYYAKAMAERAAADAAEEAAKGQPNGEPTSSNQANAPDPANAETHS